MGKSKDHQHASFSLKGRFLGFELDGYKFKRLQIATSDGEFWIKLSKESRASVVSTFLSTGRVLTPGDWVHVVGEKKLDSKTGIEKLKAHTIAPTNPGSSEIPAEDTASIAIAPSTAVQPKSTILYCQKSNCMKRGGQAMCQAIEADLRDRGLADQVELKGTGCMKQCKAAPTMVVMPGKARYTRVHPESVSEILDQHFSPVIVEPATEVKHAKAPLAAIATSISR